ncbi:hypothetical protein B0F90DRAFT_1926773 [Multifurca ochricompacta]|uniref:NB-ARC domain-containing protein n=1 Tax=Multifurca ochricompacta TaxID=376703 RepID=A0AAD4QM60_9AGAM|nr:hypothetical protein B0F90DRAFT_1926773 [Multifurca ochricompacta]
MKSKSSSLRKRLYKIFPASSSGQQLTLADTLNPAPSDDIDGYSSTMSNAIQLSLQVLKEGSAFASKIPYIAPIAGLLLQALTMRDEINQYKGECEEVMRKLIRIAGLVINVGESCRTHKLNEDDLPAGLHAIFKSLQSELDGIKQVLGECAKTRGARSLLLRKDLLGKIKKYDARLANVLEVFQAELLVDIRFAQIADRRDVHRAVPTEITTSIVQPALAPPPPQIFFGRDAELAHIIHIIFTNIGSRPGRIAILGPGGYGKTTLANAVLSHDRVQGHFEDARYFISCESAVSSDALLIQIAKTLGLETILCLDNFESPWDQSSEMKHSIEVLLSRITSLRHVTVLVTMRGAERPGQTEWTQPFLDPLGTIGLTAAKEIWKRIVGSYDDFSEKLIIAVDYVPLAVDLLARLSQVTQPMLLWEEWNSRQTKLIGRGEMHRLSNMEYSIQLSINSHRMTSNPDAKDLLGILSMLPDGLHIKQLNRFKGILVDMDMLPCIQVLQQCSLINMVGDRYQPHPIIRQFCNNQGFTSSTHKTALEGFYISLPLKQRSETYAEMVLEVNNMKGILSNILNSNFAVHPKLFDAIIASTEFCITIGDFSTLLINQSVQILLKNNVDVPLLIRVLKVWGRLCYYADDMETAKQKYLEAERWCLSSTMDVNNLHGSILTDLGLVYLCQFLLDEAEATYQKALEIYKASQDILGQGNSHFGLGQAYAGLDKLTEAEASYQKALEFHKAENEDVGLGNDYQGLGETYQKQNKLAEAEASYKNALKFYKMTNEVLGQGNAYLGLAYIYRQSMKLDEAETSYHMALELHIAANDLFGQGIDYQGLGDTYLQMDKVNEAEVSFKKALELKKTANDLVGQGIALNGLGRVHMEKSQLEEAKSVFEEALNIFEKIQGTAWGGQAKDYLDEVLAKMKEVSLESV